LAQASTVEVGVLFARFDASWNTRANVVHNIVGGAVTVVVIRGIATTSSG
jgi:hypothetical protein